MQTLFGLQLPTALFTWGLFTRCLGLMYFIALAQLIPQVLLMSGSQGIYPVSEKLAVIKRDYPAWRKLLLFPTLLWINSSDRFVKGLLYMGCLGALWSIYGGWGSGTGLVIAWMVYLSMDMMYTLSYPWDCLLLEMGFLSLLLPAIGPLPHIEALQAPYETVALAYRLLLFRLIFGFGKFKFSKLNFNDSGYFKAFMVNIPLPNVIAWYVYKLPPWVFRLFLLIAFLVEIIAPPFLFVTGITRLIAGLLIVLLMCGIWALSNFGFFNLVTIILCVPLLDTRAAVFNLHLHDLFFPWQHLLINTLLLVLFVGWFLYFFFNSWCTFTWLHWPSALNVKSKVISGILTFYRWLIRFRLMHSYGVFPPNSPPPIKWSPVYEGSEDGLTWRTFEYHYFQSTEFTKPRFLAPFHPRFDHFMFYEAYGTNDANFLSSLVGSGNPHEFTYASSSELIIQQMLKGNPSAYRLFRKSFFTAAAPPKYMRCILYRFQPTTLVEKRATGKWYTKTYAAVHLAPVGLDPFIKEKKTSWPELFYWDAVYWRNYSPGMKKILNEAKTNTGAELMISAERGLAPGTAVYFWKTLQPILTACQADWSQLLVIVPETQQAIGYPAFQEGERYWSRIALLLAEKLMPLFLDAKKNGFGIDNYFIFGLFIHHLILKGKTICEAIADNPLLAMDHRSGFSQEDALFTYGFFRFQMLYNLAGKLRLNASFRQPEANSPVLPGFSRLATFASTLFPNPNEQYPVLYCDPKNGEWTIDGEPA